MATVEEVINNSDNYIARGMESFTVDDITYTGYSEYYFNWEKSYVKSPVRSSNGSMGNLDDYATFVVPRMKVVFDVMNIEDYRKIMKQYLNKNEFTVKCYDTINDTQTTNKMYFATLEEPKWYTKANANGEVKLLGVREYTVELIGTNNE